MLENEQIDYTIMEVLEDYLVKIVNSDIFHQCLVHMSEEERTKYTDGVLEYFVNEIKAKPYSLLFGSCNPKIIAATIIYKSLIPKNFEHLTIYGYKGAKAGSLITWRELGEILGKRNIAKSYHHYNKISIGPLVEVDVETYNKVHYLGIGFYRHIVEDQKCPHCHKYISADVILV